MMKEASLLLLVVVQLLLPAAASAQCASSKVVEAPATIASATTLYLNFPSNSPLVVQTKAGSAWGFEFHGASAESLADLDLEFGAVTASGSVAVNVKTPPTGDDSTASPAVRVATGGPSQSLVLCAALLGALVSSVVVGPRRRSSMGSVLATAVLSATVSAAAVVYFCDRTTLVVTYPPGASIFVRNLRAQTCSATSASPAAVQKPVLKRSRNYMGTFWFADAIVVDLDRDMTCTRNCSEIIVCAESCRVLSSSFEQLASLSTGSRVYSPHVLCDIDGNGRYDLCAASSHYIRCWEWNSASRQFTARSNFDPLDVGVSGELRGMAAADLDGDGADELIVTSTNSQTQIFAYKSSGSALLGWPRYNTDEGDLGDGTGNGQSGRNGMGHYRYGSYGLNVGIGNLDDDINPELVTTYDDHQIQVFKRTGIALNAASNFTNPRSGSLRGMPMTYGQLTARWTNRTTDEGHYIDHSCWPFVSHTGDPCYSATPCVPGGDEWLQFTQVPASVVDLDLDGKNEIVSLPNSELGFNSDCSSYITQNRVLFVIDGSYGNAGNPEKTTERAGKRHAGFDAEWPPKGKTITCQECCNPTCTCRNQRWYPPEAVPAVAWGDISGTEKPELVFGFGDGSVYGYGADGTKLWTFDFAAHAGIDPQTRAIECSEPVLVDLNQDGVPEVIFSVYGYPVNPPSSSNNQRLIILSNAGTLLHEILLSTAEAAGGDTSFNGNGNGGAAAPTVADIDNDGQLEILVNTFDGRLLAYTVPGSAPNCMLWQTARGGWLRKGQPDYAPNP